MSGALAMLCPGQGAQEVGMGVDLAERWPSARRVPGRPSPSSPMRTRSSRCSSRAAAVTAARRLALPSWLTCTGSRRRSKARRRPATHFK